MRALTRRNFLGAAAAAGASPFLPAQTPPRPNILLILADDLGYGNLGCYGATEIKTPNLDRMAAEGMRFSQAYAGSTVCAPSRCCLMTGYHTGHARTRGNRYPDLPLRSKDITVTEILKNAGYRTGLFGKWSLGQLGSTGYPTKKGFDEWFGFFSQTHAHNYYPEHLLDGETAYLCRGNFGARKEEYAHDLFTKRGLDFIARKDGRPWFLKLSYTIPHANNELGRDTGNGMEVPHFGEYADKPWPVQEKGFAAMVSRMDADVGRILEKLKETGQDENTLILFSSDNGPHREGGHDPEFFKDSGPLRGIKRDLYEGGIRVPTLARWPARIKPGQVSDHAWAFWDFLPTAAEIAGQVAPPGIDGISFLPALTGGRQPKHEYFCWEFHERGFKQAIRMGDWKAVRLSRSRPVELYNLAEDLGETKDLASKNPGIVKKMEELFATARTESEFWPVKDS
jgi:arylsulfatase A-like enzyme